MVSLGGGVLSQRLTFSSLRKLGVCPFYKSLEYNTDRSDKVTSSRDSDKVQGFASPRKKGQF